MVPKANYEIRMTNYSSFKNGTNVLKSAVVCDPLRGSVQFFYRQTYYEIHLNSKTTLNKKWVYFLSGICRFLNH